MEKADDRIIDVDLALASVRTDKKLSDLLTTTQDMFNFGTNLLVRCFCENRHKKIEDMVVLTVLYKQFLCHTDSVIEQARNGQLISLGLQLRSILELSLFIQYILEDEKKTSEICKHYYVYTLREERKTCNDATKLGINDPSFSTRLAEINKTLSKPNFNLINTLFDQKKHKWYQLSNKSIPNIFKLAEYLKRDREYLGLFATLSGTVHGTNMNSHLNADNDGIFLEHIRVTTENTNSLIPPLSLCGTYMLVVYRLLLNKYRPKELTNLANIYKERWQKTLLS